MNPAITQPRSQCAASTENQQRRQQQRDDQTKNAALKTEPLTWDASTRRTEAFRHAFGALLSPGGGVPQETPTGCWLHLPRPLRIPNAYAPTRRSELGPSHPAELRGRAGRPSDPQALGGGGIQAEGLQGRRGRGERAGPPRAALVTPAGNCLKGRKAGDATGRGRGAGTPQAPGEATLGGCGPREGKRPTPPGPPRRPDAGASSSGGAGASAWGGPVTGQGAPRARDRPREPRGGVGSGRDAHPPAKRWSSVFSFCCEPVAMAAPVPQARGGSKDARGGPLRWPRCSQASAGAVPMRARPHDRLPRSAHPAARPPALHPPLRQEAGVQWNPTARPSRGGGRVRRHAAARAQGR